MIYFIIDNSLIVVKLNLNRLYVVQYNLEKCRLHGSQINILVTNVIFSRRFDSQRRRGHQPLRHVPLVGHARGEQERDDAERRKLPDASQPTRNARTTNRTKHSGSSETYLADNECKWNKTSTSSFCIISKCSIYK